MSIRVEQNGCFSIASLFDNNIQGVTKWPDTPLILSALLRRAALAEWNLVAEDVKDVQVSWYNDIFKAVKEKQL